MSEKLLYIEISNKIRDMIISSKNNYKLPSERTLTKSLSVSRTTLRQAIQILVEEGIIEKRQGSANFIKDRNVHKLTSEDKSFKEEMLEINKHYNVKILEFKKEHASLEISLHLHIKENDPVYYFERIFYTKEKVFLLEKSYMPLDLFSDLTKKQLKLKYDYIENVKKLPILDCSQNITASLSDKNISALLKINPVAILCISLYLRLSNGRYADYSRQYYHPDYSFSIIRQRNLK